MLLAEDIGGSDLTEMNNRFHELEAFHDQVHSYNLLAEYGAQDISDMSRRMRRIRSYNLKLVNGIKLIILKACDHHFNFDIWYRYDNQTSTIVSGENISFADCEDD